MKIVLLDAATLGAGLDLSKLSRFGEVVTYDGTEQSEASDRISDADIVIVNKFKIKKETIKKASSLKLICIFATGYDNIDIEACQKQGIAVCNVKGYSTHSVAQLTVLLALALLNRLSEYTDFVASGKYTKSGRANYLDPIYHELYGKTWGIVGAGAIGSQVARVAKAFGCRVLAFKRTQADEFECVSLEKLLKESDIISLHTPLNDGTRGLIGEKELALMKKSAVLINAARGAVTDEAAVARAVLDKKIGGFAADVYTAEPFPKEHPFASLLNCKNVLLTPHMAWSAIEARSRCLDEIICNIEAFLRGETRNRVDI